MLQVLFHRRRVNFVPWSDRVLNPVAYYRASYHCVSVPSALSDRAASVSCLRIDHALHSAIVARVISRCAALAVLSRVLLPSSSANSLVVVVDDLKCQ